MFKLFFVMLVVFLATSEAAFSWFGAASTPVKVDSLSTRETWEEFKAKFHRKTPGKTVTTGISDIPVNGVEGIDVKLVVPWKLGTSGFVAGLKYNVERVFKFPDELFLKKSFTGVDSGVLTLEADYKYADDSFGLAGDWTFEDIGLKFSASGDTNNLNFFNDFGIQLKETVEEAKLSLEGTYDFVKAKFTGNALLEGTGISARLTADSIAADPVLAISYDIDERNTISPAVSLRYGDSSYAWTHAIKGGSVKTTLYPYDKINFVWKDEGTDGTWTAKVEVPIEYKYTAATGKSSKFSITREWAY